MPLAGFAIFFALLGALFIALEALHSFHGLFLAAGALMFVAAVVVAFYLGQWIGVGALVGLIVAFPAVEGLFAHVAPRYGHRGRLRRRQADEKPLRVGPVFAGDLGVAASDLRPSGVVEINAERVQAVCDHGAIPRGARIQVTGFRNGRPVVRPAQQAAEA